jgi:hypothetical protein
LLAGGNIYALPHHYLGSVDHVEQSISQRKQPSVRRTAWMLGQQFLIFAMASEGSEF